MSPPRPASPFPAATIKPASQASSSESTSRTQPEQDLLKTSSPAGEKSVGQLGIGSPDVKAQGAKELLRQAKALKKAERKKREEEQLKREAQGHQEPGNGGKSEGAELRKTGMGVVEAGIDGHAASESTTASSTTSTSTSVLPAATQHRPPPRPSRVPGARKPGQSALVRIDAKESVAAYIKRHGVRDRVDGNGDCAYESFACQIGEEGLDADGVRVRLSKYLHTDEGRASLGSYDDGLFEARRAKVLVPKEMRRPDWVPPEYWYSSALTGAMADREGRTVRQH